MSRMELDHLRPWRMRLVVGAGCGTATKRWGRVVVPIALLERTMQVGDPEEEIEKVAQAGIRGMVGALGRETVSPHVTIEAALHVLAAWVASSQTHSPTAERAEEVDELLEILPSYIEYHRTAGWLPEPHRNNN